ncbi:hypothetical protein F5Y05DRAFT_409909 [Hypoxylon sp. FL0543]|nr:hypothetical protein F5Y05DRAFT_409909 [Hypoxylon sp. FL0543]
MRLASNSQDFQGRPGTLVWRRGDELHTDDGDHSILFIATPKMIASFFTLVLFSNPATALAVETSLVDGFVHRRCGAVAQFYNPTPSDWQKNNVDQWFSAWMTNHSSDISSATHGFTGAFGNYAIGDPDFSCHIDGSEGHSCTVVACDNRVLNDLGDNIRPAYYVLEAIQGLTTYFQGFKDAMFQSAIVAAFEKEYWTTMFYQPKSNDERIMIWREIINAGIAIIGIITAVASAGAAAAGVAAAGAAAIGASGAIASGALGAGSIAFQALKDDSFQKDATLGDLLGTMVGTALSNFTDINNDLMMGKTVDNADIKTYLQGGAFVNYPGVDITGTVSVLNAFLQGTAINQLWRQQKIFIMGGAKCGDGQGIGSGPKDYSICRDGKAWYLYYWHEGNGNPFTSKQWGYVTMPPGADQLGKGDFQGVTVADVINSSIDSYNVAEYNYTADKAQERVKEAIEQGWRNPGAQGPSWEGTFTIPVCDVSQIVPLSTQQWPLGKQYILQDYGDNSRPVWCGPVCNGDWAKTSRFINAANMGGFKSPKHLCTDQGMQVKY